VSAAVFNAIMRTLPSLVVDHLATDLVDALLLARPCG
jgi:hypothetical protein